MSASEADRNRARQLAIFEIESAFERGQADKVLQLITQFNETFGEEPHLQEIAEKAMELKTVSAFVSTCRAAFERYIDEGELAKAAEELKKIEHINPDYPEMPVLRQQLSPLREQPDEENTPLTIEERLDQAVVLFYQKQYQAARKRFQGILRENPTHLKALKLMQECDRILKQQGTAGGSIAKSDDELESDPFPNSESILGPILADFMEQDEQENHPTTDSKGSLQETPHADMTAMMVESSDDATLNHAMEQNNSPAIQVNGNKLLNIESQLEEVKTSLANQFAAMGKPPVDLSNIEESDDNETIKIPLTRLVAMMITFFVAISVMIGVWQYEKAKIRKKKNTIASLIKHGKLEAQQDNFVKARELWHKALKLDPENNKIRDLISQSMTDERNLLAEKQKTVRILLNKAGIALKMKKFDEANGYVSQAQQLKVLPEKVKEMQQLIAQEKQKEEDIKKVKEKLKKEQTDRLFREAEFYFRHKRFNEAFLSVSRLLSIDPQHELGQSLKKMIQEERLKRKARHKTSPH